MASSSNGVAASSVSASGSEEEQQLQHQQLMTMMVDQRKRKRMISNRESARRSRMRKQKHLDDLMAQLARTRKENNQMIAAISSTTQLYINVETENSILRAQTTELTQRLESLNGIITLLNSSASTATVCFGSKEEYSAADESRDCFNNNNSWDYLLTKNQPRIAPLTAIANWGRSWLLPRKQRHGRVLESGLRLLSLRGQGEIEQALKAGC